MPTDRNFRIDQTEATSAMNTPIRHETAQHRWIGLEVTHLGH
jgi:hypothetical protein